MKKRRRITLRLISAIIFFVAFRISIRLMLEPRLRDGRPYAPLYIGLFAIVAAFLVLSVLYFLISYKKYRTEKLVNATIMLTSTLSMMVIIELVSRLIAEQPFERLSPIIFFVGIFPAIGLISFLISGPMKKKKRDNVIGQSKSLGFSNILLIILIIALSAELSANVIWGPDYTLGYEEMDDGTTLWRRPYHIGTENIFVQESRLDHMNRRTVGHEYDDDRPNVMLFGCSYTFGDAIDDNETLQYNLHEVLEKENETYDIYNYAWPGKGPHNILYLLRNRKINSELSLDTDMFADVEMREDNIGIFQILPAEYVRRTVSPRFHRLMTDPYYEIRNGSIVSEGSFFEKKTVYAVLYGNYEVLSEWSYFLDTFDPFEQFENSPTSISEEDIYNTMLIIKESREIFLEEYGGEFYVVMNPLHNDDGVTDIFKELFKEEGIPYLYYEEFEEGGSEEFRVYGEGHPNGKHNELLAELLAEDIFLER